MTDPRIRLLAAHISVAVSHERLRRIGEPIPFKHATFDQLPADDRQTWTDVATVVAGLSPPILDDIVRKEHQMEAVNSQDRDGNILAIEVLTPDYNAAYTIERGELLECVDRNDFGAWDWPSAAVCDPARGSNPELQRAIRAALGALTEQAATA